MASDFLFARPSYLTGVARILDLGGQFDAYNVSRTPAEADVRAIMSDWAMVGLDLNRAVAHVGAQIRVVKQPSRGVTHVR